MTDAVVLAALLGGVGGIVLTLLLILARRFARGASGLGSEAEEATYRFACGLISCAAKTPVTGARCGSRPSSSR